MTTHTPAPAPQAAPAPAKKWYSNILKGKIRKTVLGLLTATGIATGYYGFHEKDEGEGIEFRDTVKDALVQVHALESQGLQDDARIKQIKEALQALQKMDNGQVDDLGEMETAIGPLDKALHGIAEKIDAGATLSDISGSLDAALGSTNKIESKSLEDAEKGLQDAIKNLQQDMQNQPKNYSWMSGNFFTKSWGGNVAKSFGIDANEINSKTLSHALKELSENPTVLSEALTNPDISNLFLHALQVENGHSALLGPIPDTQSLTIGLTKLLEGSTSSYKTAWAERGGIAIVLFYILSASFGGGYHHKKAKQATDPADQAESIKNRNFWLTGKPVRAITIKPAVGVAKIAVRGAAAGGRIARGRMDAKALAKIADAKSLVQEKHDALTAEITSHIEYITKWEQYFSGITTSLPALHAEFTRITATLVTFSRSIDTLEQTIISGTGTRVDVDNLTGMREEQARQQVRRVSLGQQYTIRDQALRSGGEGDVLIIELAQIKALLLAQQRTISAINLAPVVKVDELQRQEAAIATSQTATTAIFQQLVASATKCEALRTKFTS